MGIRYAEITLRVKIPADQYRETLDDLLDEIRRAARSQLVECEALYAHTPARGGPDGA
jgi:hypothetical protein